MSTQAVTPKHDVYEQIRQAVIEAIEAAAEAYRMPWHNLETPVNATNQKPYRGINSVMLWAIAQKHGYVHPQWGTYRQWQELGAQVRKGGERSATVVFWKFFDVGADSEPPDAVEEDQTKRQLTLRGPRVAELGEVLLAQERWTQARPVCKRLLDTVEADLPRDGEQL